MPRLSKRVAVNALVAAGAVVTLSTPLGGSVPRAAVPAAPPARFAPDQTSANLAPRRAKPRKPAQSFEEFQVAAGTYLPVELRSRLSSTASRPADYVEGRLLRPITVDGVDVVPAGAAVIGAVSHVEPADAKTPGKLAFSFHVIEHPETGSRAMIKTRVLSYESALPQRGKPLPEVVLEKGSDASVALLAPLLVRLPVR